MTMGPGFMGQAGTRVQGKADKKITEYITQAFVGACSANVFVGCAIALWAVSGWMSTPLVFGFLGMIYVVLYWMIAKPRRYWVKPVLSLAWIVIVAVGGIASHALWDWLFNPAAWEGIDLLLSVFVFPRWAWAVALVLYGAIAIKWGIKRTWWIPLFALVGGAAIGFSKWDAFLPILQRGRYLAIPFVPAFAFFAVVLSMALMRELLWPNLEWTLKPIQLSELREIGLIGLWFPRLVTKWIASGWKPTVRKVVELRDHDGDHTIRYAEYEETDEVLDFYGLLATGADFTNRTGEDAAGLTRKQYEQQRTIFERHGWVQWKDPENRNLGLVLTGRGERKVRELAGLSPSPTPGETVGESAE
jgi:hypothetical protein